MAPLPLSFSTSLSFSFSLSALLFPRFPIHDSDFSSRLSTLILISLHLFFPSSPVRRNALEREPLEALGGERKANSKKRTPFDTVKSFAPSTTLLTLSFSSVEWRSGQRGEIEDNLISLSVSLCSIVHLCSTHDSLHDSTSSPEISDSPFSLASNPLARLEFY